MGHLAVILGPPCLDQDRLRDIFLRKIAPETSQSPSGTSQTPSGPPSFASHPRFLKLPESIFVRPSPKERGGRCSPQASSICIAILRRYKSFIENVDFGIYEWCLGFYMVFPGFMKVPFFPVGFMPSWTGIYESPIFASGIYAVLD